MRKYTKGLLILLLVFTFCIGIQVKADERVNSNFPSSIKVDRGGLVTYGATVYKKHYNNDGKAMCTSFWKDAASSATCQAVKWNRDDTKNKKIAVAIGAMINKARTLTNLGGGLDWDKYVYLEMAINNFLYHYNNENNNNNVAKHWNWGNISSNKIYQSIYGAGTTAYNNYGKTSVTLSGAKISLNEKTVTASVKLTCYNASGKVTDCSAQVKQTLKITGTAIDESTVSKIIDATYEKDKDTKVYTLNYTATFDKDFAANSVVKGDFSTKNQVSYAVAQNYDCGSNYQPLTPNMLKTLYLYDRANTSAKTSGVSCSINVNKKNSAGVALNGAKFNLYSDATLKDKVATAVSNGSGKLSFEGLDAGTYYLKEVVAPSGYVLDGTVRQITLSIDGNSCSSSVDVTNNLDTGNLIINKVDGDNNAVAGAKVKIYTVTSTDSNAPVENLEIVSSDTAESGGDYNDSDRNEYNFNYLRFDKEGNYNPNGEYDYFVTTDVAKTITGLTVGQTYYVVEDSLPENSDYAAKVREGAVLIKEGGQTYSIDLVNVHSKFSISKQDITSKKELPGATLEIRDSRDIVIQTWTSTDKPQEIVGLSDGDYTLVETTAPNGYKVSESISFTIENGKLKDDDDNTLVMYDSVVVDVPDTFTTKNIITMIAGLVLVAAGTSLLVYEIRKKKTA